MSTQQDCPKCGHTFYTRNDPPRVTCHRCGTAWNTGGGYGGEGCAVIIGIIVFVIFFLESCG